MITKAIHGQWLRAAMLACALAFTATSNAQTLDFGSCVRIEDLSARLACYDRAAGRAPSASAPSAAPAVAPLAIPIAPAPLPTIPPPGARAPAPATQPLLVPEMPRDPVATFGATDKTADPLTAKAAPKKEPAKELSQIEARVTNVRTRPEGQQVLTLDNGQVWTQTETKRDPQFAVGDVVIIKRGVLGSFLLTLQKGSASTRVQRIS